MPAGLGVFLFTGAAIGIVVALASSYPGSVAQPQDGAAALLGLIGASIFASLPGTPEADRLATVLAAIAATSLLTGGVFLLLGALELGTLVRFIPYPVIGGFLAGSGWLFVRGSIAVMTGAALDLTEPLRLVTPSAALRWAPGLVFAVALLAALRRSRHFLLVPGMLIGASALFYVAVFALGHSFADARANGWLLGPFPESGGWQPFALVSGSVHWGTLVGEIPKMATVVAVSVIALLLNSTGLELATRRDLDLNRELRTAGLANVVSGLGGGAVGFQSLSATILGHAMGTERRLIGVLSGLICAAGLAGGTAVLGYLPKPLLGGLLLFMGLSLLIEWLWQTWFTLPRGDYAIVLLIVVTIGLLGYMPGVAVGILVAIVFFVVNVSRISVVRRSWSGADYRSNVDRSEKLESILRKKGDCVDILELAGFIFFGTANGLLNRVRARAMTGAPLRFVIVDFRQVVGIDSSATASFVKMKDLAERRSFTLIFSAVPEGLRQRFARVGLGADAAIFRSFVDVDHALEWCEERILDVEAPGWASSSGAIRDTLAALLPRWTDVDGLLAHLERHAFERGAYLIHQGERAEDVFFIESGRVTVEIAFGSERARRLRSYGPGALVGEMALYLGQIRAAAVVADEPTIAYRLTAAALARMDTTLAAAFHESMVRVVARRLADANRLIQRAFEA